MSRMDEYIRKIAKESTSIPEDQKQKIREHFIAKQLQVKGKWRRCYCPTCEMPTPRISKYCCNCGQKVTLEKPSMACLD